jgi:hypothetical protein
MVLIALPKTSVGMENVRELPIVNFVRDVTSTQGSARTTMESLVRTLMDIPSNLVLT